MGNRIEAVRITRRDLLRAVAGAAGLKLLKVDRTFAEHDGVTPNVRINEALSYEYTHPMTGDEVWSYGVQFRNPLLPGAGLHETGIVGEVLLTGEGDVGLDVKTDPTYLADYKGNGARPAIWLTTGPNDRVILMDQTAGKNDPVAAVIADDGGFAGYLLSEDKAQQLGIRVVRTSSSKEPVLVRFGNISQTDLDTKIPNPNVIDVTSAIKKPAGVVVESQASVDFLPEGQVLKWADAAGRGFFRPLSSKGEGYTKFIEFSVPSSSAFFARDKGNVGEFFFLVRGAQQIRLDLKTHAPFVDHLRQGQAAPALWLDNMQPGARLQIHETGGVVLAEARGDDAGFGGIELPDFDAQLIVTVDIPFASSAHDIRVQMGPARTADLAKSSTVKLAGVDPARLRAV